MTYNEYNSGDENNSSGKEQEFMEFTGVIHDSPRRKKKKVHFNFKVFLRSLFTTLLIAFIVLAGWRVGVFTVDFFTAKNNGLSTSEAFSYAWNGTVNFFAEIVEDVSPVMLTDKNILVIGSDENKINADVIMLVRLDAQTKSVDIISVLRDTMIKVNGRSYKINASLQLGGEEFVAEQVENILGVDIDNYVFINYKGFKEVIDAIGGVDFYVPQDMFYNDPEQDLYINLREGQQHLDGSKAEQLVRFRQYPMGDIQRTQVQRDFVLAIYKQKLNSGLLKNYKELIPAVMGFVDTNVGVTDALQYAGFIKDFNPDSINSYQMPVKIVEGSPYVHADTAAIDKMMKEIEESHKVSETEGDDTVETTSPEYTYRDTPVDEHGEYMN